MTNRTKILEEMSFAKCHNINKSFMSLKILYIVILRILHALVNGLERLCALFCFCFCFFLLQMIGNLCDCWDSSMKLVIFSTEYINIPHLHILHSHEVIPEMNYPQWALYLVFRRGFLGIQISMKNSIDLQCNLRIARRNVVINTHLFKD